jgi:hypothetical protein
MSNATQREPGKTHYRTIFLSDIHLGTRGCQAERLLDFLWKVVPRWWKTITVISGSSIGTATRRRTTSSR